MHFEIVLPSENLFAKMSVLKIFTQEFYETV